MAEPGRGVHRPIAFVRPVPPARAGVTAKLRAAFRHHETPGCEFDIAYCLVFPTLHRAPDAPYTFRATVRIALSRDRHADSAKRDGLRGL